MLKVIRFTSANCVPCKALAPIMDQLSLELGIYAHFTTVDIDRDRAVAAQKGVSSVPTVIVERDGVEIARIVGARPKSAYESIIKKS